MSKPPVDWKHVCTEAMEMTRRAVAEGRHSRATTDVCSGCREWVTEIWQRADKKQFCPMCCARKGFPNTRELLQKFYPEQFRKLLAEEAAAIPRAMEVNAPAGSQPAHFQSAVTQ